MRVGRPLPNFWFQEEIESLLHGRISPFLVAGPESMRGRKLERIFFLLVCEHLDSRKLPSTFLKRKREQNEVRISDLCVDPWKNESMGISWKF